MNWTIEQLEIFKRFAECLRNLVIRARAGTGKTTTILHGVTLAVWARSILICAFNKRIAEELKAKCKDPRAEIKTLHAIGMGCITRAWGRVNVNERREYLLAETLAPRGTTPGVLSCIAKLAVKIKEIAPRAMLENAIDLAWQFDCLPEETGEAGSASAPSVEEIAALALRVCEASKVRGGEISFADMLYLPVTLGLVRPFWDLVVVDEAQDMSPTQIELALLCTKPNGRTIVVGDDRQAIYAFRGADSRTIDNLLARLDAEELTLTVTQRCPKAIVRYAQTLVPDYVAADTAPEGEIESIQARELVATASAGDFILSRRNAPLLAICFALLRAGKRAKVQGKDVAASLLALVKRLKARSVPELLAKLSAWEAREIKRSEASAKGNSETRTMQVRDMAEMLVLLAHDARSVEDIGTRIGNMFEEISGDAPSIIVCSSVHKAKGLEANRVFVIRATLYPGKAGKASAGIEECNIEYVAVTRAKRTLVWVEGEEYTPEKGAR